MTTHSGRTMCLIRTDLTRANKSHPIPPDINNLNFTKAEFRHSTCNSHCRKKWHQEVKVTQFLVNGNHFPKGKSEQNYPPILVQSHMRPCPKRMDFAPLCTFKSGYCLLLSSPVFTALQSTIFLSKNVQFSRKAEMHFEIQFYVNMSQINGNCSFAIGN